MRSSAQKENLALAGRTCSLQERRQNIGVQMQEL